MLRGSEAPMEFEYSKESADRQENTWMKETKRHLMQALLEKSMAMNFAFEPASPTFVSSPVTTEPTEPLLESEDKQRNSSSVDLQETLSKSVEKQHKTKSFKTKFENKSRKRKRTLEFASPDSSTSHTATSNMHFHIPYILMQYIYLLFSMFIIGIICYLITQFILTVQHDLRLKQDEYVNEVTQQIQECFKQFSLNKCDPETRIPAIEKVCNEWELCMMKDPKEIGRLKMGAETIAEILNKLVDPLSYKTMFFGLTLFFGAMFSANSALLAIRARPDTSKTILSIPSSSQASIVTTFTPNLLDNSSQQSLGFARVDNKSRG